ncbi:hypothetical protein AB0P15_33755 [Streptomyces sp. NPDC087917]|uniref:hypothetical protein n=1 Tax=Streptomyces sp. NPDC087917 TaxID=3155060 RepID=UPI00344A7C1E
MPGLGPAIRIADFFGLGSIDYFVKPSARPLVCVVERRLALLEAARLTGQPVPPPTSGVAAEPDVGALVRRLRDNSDVLAISHRSAGVSPKDQATAAGPPEPRARDDSGGSVRSPRPASGRTRNVVVRLARRGPL